MNRLLIIILLLLYSATNMAQPSWIWASRGGGSGWDKSFSVTTDYSGNVYITGYIEGTSPFGTDTLISHGQYDVFVAKFDSIGNLLWARNGGGNANDEGYSVAADPYGNCYVTGKYIDTAVFGAVTLPSSGSLNMFIARYDASGSLTWVQPVGNFSYGGGVSTDSSGNLYVAGRFSGTAYFGSYTLVSTGLTDIFVAKYDSTGTVLWASQGGSPSFPDQCFRMKTDAAGNSYLVGEFGGTAVFGSDSITSSGPYSDIFIVKVDSLGQFLWTRKGSGSDVHFGYYFDLDAFSNCYVGGLFRNDVTFDTLTHYAIGSNIVPFIVKIDSSGTAVWANSGICSTNFFSMHGIAADAAGCSYMSGNFDGTATFGGFNVSSTLSSADAFITKFDAAGNVLWLQQGGSNATESDASVACDAAGNLYVTGHYMGTSSLFGTHSLPLNGASDVFLARLGNTLLTSTEVNPSTHKNQLLLYPNPAREWITISGLGRPIEKIELYNVFSDMVTVYPLYDQIRIDLTAFSPGLYIVRATGNGVTATSKFIRY